MGRCCLDGYGAQGVVWSDPDTRKATARYLCIRPTTQPLHQGAGNAGTTRPEESIAKWSYKSTCGSEGRGFEPREDGSAFHVFNPAVMVVQCNVPILMPVELKLCKLWQILHDQALKFVAEFSLLFEFGPFTFRNIAHGKKRS